MYLPTSPLGRSSVFGSPWIWILVGKKESANVDKDKDEKLFDNLKTFRAGVGSWNLKPLRWARINRRKKFFFKFNKKFLYIVRNCIVICWSLKGLEHVKYLLSELRLAIPAFPDHSLVCSCPPPSCGNRFQLFWLTPSCVQLYLSILWQAVAAVLD